ncbi:hypothetical protein PG993_000979 [Apiospora rasikravindrae]|uniref:Asl1-like glycosyl hydrolase catalytic domain-containing protein n=1 Tax=Apiospora rasikravindrae TaxID=990691 RepID=A0ABR1UA32_9PEZI
MHALLRILTLSLLAALSQAAPTTPEPRGTTGPKVGLAVSNKDLPDLQALVTGQTRVSWYYTWDLNTSHVIQSANPGAEFLPQIGPHDLDFSRGSDQPVLATDPAQKLRGLRKTGSKRLLCFNEPNIRVADGGTWLAPDVVAKYYKHAIMPLQKDGWQISHPVVSAGQPGLDWLSQFRTACKRLNGGADCPADFVSAHWYGPAAGLEDWTDKLHAFYQQQNGGDRLKFWFTELGDPKAGQEGKGTDADNQKLLETARTVFSSKPYVEAYAWFGATRRNQANRYTGPGVSLFEDNGKLSVLGNMLKSG